MKIGKILIWLAIAAAGALALATIAFHRREPISAMWLVVAALCSYALGYRFYSKFVAAKVLALDAMRATPAERLENGRDFVRTNKWVVFGHHFAAIAGPGPLVGPVLAAQFGYLPGTLWILVGAVFAGCVQDFVILLFSVRRDGKSLGQMAREEISKTAGTVAFISVLSILVILLAVVALIIVNALKDSPWGAFTIGMTIPIALLMGVYLRYLRPGRVLEASVLGFLLVVAAIFGGQWISQSTHAGGIHVCRDHSGNSYHRVWFCCVGTSGVAAAGAARLPEHVCKTWHRRDPCSGDCSGAPHVADACAHTLYRWQRAGFCRQSISIRVYHHRMRRYQRISFADFQRHHAQDDCPRNANAHGWLWRNDGGIVCRDHGHDRRMHIAARNVPGGK